MQHPADRALYYREAKRHAGVDERSEKMRLKEVRAGFEAANCAETSSEGLSWLLRAGESLDLPVRNGFPYSNDRSLLFLDDADKREQMELGVEIWHRAGEMLMKESEISLDFRFMTIMDNTSLRIKEVAAARCFHLAGNALSIDDHESEKAKAMYQRAYDVLKKVEPISLSNWEASLLQREIADMSEYIDLETAFSEKKRAAESYAKLAKSDSKTEFELKLEQAILLYQAGNCAQALEEKKELFEQARDLLETLWEKDSSLCKNMNRFHLDPQRTWLSHLRTECARFSQSWLEQLLG